MKPEPKKTVLDTKGQFILAVAFAILVLLFLSIFLPGALANFGIGVQMTH